MNFFENYAIVTMESNNVTFYACKVIKLRSGFNLKDLQYSFIYIFQKPINCECNEIGGYNGTCNEQTGKCLCSPGYSGDTCEKRKLTKGKHQCSKHGN